LPDSEGTVGFVTLGCPKNQVDTEVMQGILEDAGFRIVLPENADTVVVNTCGFIQEAQEESIETILALAQGRRVVAVGCLVERFGDQLAREIPEVKTWIGLGAEHRIAGILKNGDAGVFLDQGPPVSMACWRQRRLVSPHFSYLKLGEGCDNRCGYCAIPLIRGGQRSRPREEILAEARLMLEAGIKEINLIAQDLTAWGMDTGERGGLTALLRELDALEGGFWLRLLYLHPAGITPELVETIATASHLVPYLEMPIQHIDSQVLDAMGRRGGAEAVEKALGLLEALPGVALRTTVLVGFPAETDESFERLCGFLRELSPWRLAAFGYSPQEGTPAARLKPLPQAEVMERLEEVLSIAEEIHWQRNRELVGCTLPALVESGKEGRVALQAPEIDGVAHLKGDAEPGCFATIEVEDADGVDLYCRVT